MKKLSKKKIREAIHVVGHLLETNGTKYCFARDEMGESISPLDTKACSFCLSGAVRLVNNYLLRTSEFTMSQLYKEIQSVLDTAQPLSDVWDRAGVRQTKIVRALKNA